MHDRLVDMIRTDSHSEDSDKIMQLLISILPLCKLEEARDMAYIRRSAHTLSALAPRFPGHIFELFMSLLQLAYDHLHRQQSISYVIDLLGQLVGALSIVPLHLPAVLAYMCWYAFGLNDSASLLSIIASILENRAAGKYGRHSCTVLERYVVMPLVIHTALNFDTETGQKVISIAQTLVSSSDDEVVMSPQWPVSNTPWTDLPLLTSCMDALTTVIATGDICVEYLDAVRARLVAGVFPQADSRTPHIPTISTSITPFVMSALLLHPSSVVSNAVYGGSSLVAHIAKLSPLHGIMYLPTIMYRLQQKETNAETSMLILRTIPSLLTHHSCVTNVLTYVMPMLSHPSLQDIGLSLLTDMFVQQRRLLERVQLALAEIEPVLQQQTASHALELAYANAVRRICEHKPTRGSEMVKQLNTLFSSPKAAIVSLALQAMRYLVEAEEVQLKDALSILLPVYVICDSYPICLLYCRIGDDDRPVVLQELLSLFSAEAAVANPESSLTQDIIGIIKFVIFD